MSIVRKDFIRYDCSVLFVEDDKNILELAKDILFNKVNNLFLAENSVDAYNIYCKYKPDILITDIVMPGQSGLELAKKIKELNENVEIIISSAFNEVEYLTKSIEIGVSSYIVKPFDERKVLSALEKSWNSINLKRELKKREEELKLINKELENRVKEKTERLLHEYEFRNKLIEIDPSFIILSNLEGEIKFANNTVLTILNYTREEIEDKNVFKIFFNGCNEISQETLNDLIREKKQFESFLEINGRKIFILWNFRYIKSENEPIEILFFGTDISSKKYYEDLLARKNSLLESIVKSTNELITNKNYEDTISYSLQRIKNIDKTIDIYYLNLIENGIEIKSIIYPHEDKDKLNEEFLQRLFVEEIKNRIEKSLDEKIHQIKYNNLNFYVIPIFVYSKIRGLLLFFTRNNEEEVDKGKVYALEIFANSIGNIIENKLSEIELRKLSEALEHSSSIVIITDRNGIIEYVNKKFSEVTLYEKEEVIGLNPKILKSGQVSLDVYSDMWETILSGKEWQGEFFNKKKNSDYYWALTSISPLFDESGKITHFIAIQQDITSQKKITSELEKAKLQAESASKAKTIFLSNVSHELKTPLNGIIGMASLLEKTNLNDKQLEYINLLKSSANVLHKLLSDIMDVTKIESGKVQLFNEVFSLTSKIKKVVDSFSVQITEKNLKISYKIDPRIPTFLIGDFVRLQQILNNLISNAIKFTEKGFIELSVQLKEICSDKVMLLFIVEDTGIGIPKEKFDLLFKRFYQIDSTLTKKYKGLGLGLAISKDLVEIMGGKIWLESEPDKGSKFYFTIQLSTMEKISKPFSEKETDKTNIINNKGKILLADDNQVNAYLLSSFLTEKGYCVDIVYNGKEVLSKLDQFEYDVILMDIQMPVMDGLETIVKIREREKVEGGKNYVIAVSAFNSEEEKHNCLSLGIDYCISKPVDFPTLLSIIETKRKNTELTEMINLENMLKAINYNSEIFYKLVNHFSSTYQEKLNNLIEYCNIRDYENVSKLAHFMKSTVSNFGAKNLIELIKLIEQKAKEKKLDDVDKILTVLVDELNKLNIFLKEYKIKK